MDRRRFADEKEPCVHPRADPVRSRLRSLSRWVGAELPTKKNRACIRAPKLGPALTLMCSLLPYIDSLGSRCHRIASSSLSRLWFSLSLTTRPHQKRNLLLLLLHSQFCRDFAAWKLSIFHSCITLFEISLESFALAQFCFISSAVAVAVAVHR
jgi:hypothetical protein